MENKKEKFMERIEALYEVPLPKCMRYYVGALGMPEWTASREAETKERFSAIMSDMKKADIIAELTFLDKLITPIEEYYFFNYEEVIEGTSWSMADSSMQTWRDDVEPFLHELQKDNTKTELLSLYYLALDTFQGMCLALICRHR